MKRLIFILSLSSALSWATPPPQIENNPQGLPQVNNATTGPASTPEANKPAGNSNTPVAQQKPVLVKQPEVSEMVKAGIKQNADKTNLQSGVNNNQAAVAQFNASTAEMAMRKAKVEEMAKSGKYDLTGYDEAMAAMGMMAQSFNYQPGGQGGGGSESSSGGNQDSGSSTPRGGETSTTAGLNLNSNIPEAAPLSAGVPNNEIADTRIPASDAATLGSGASVSQPAPSTPSPAFVAPMISAPPTAPPGVGGNSPQGKLEQLEAGTGNLNAGAGGSLTAVAPARGLASEDSEPTLTEEEAAAILSKKLAEDHKNKVLDKSKSVDDKSNKPSLADRLKAGGVSAASDSSRSSFDGGTAGPDVPSASLRDDLFWYGPQRFGRVLMEAAGLEKQLGLDKPRRDVSSTAVAPVSGAMAWLQVILGWFSAAVALLGAGYAMTRESVRAMFRGNASEASTDSEDNHKEPSGGNDLQTISIDTLSGSLEIEVLSSDGRSSAYVMEKSGRKRLATNSVVPSKFLKGVSPAPTSDRVKYLGNGKFAKTSEPVCILVHTTRK